jgi:hypothetical protein
VAPERTPADVLAEAFAGVGPDDEPLLALYVYGLCLEKWEDSEDYDSIEAVLDALLAVQSKSEDAAGAELFGIVKDHAQHLKPAMGVEKAMNCSCPVAMAKRAGEVGPILGALLERELRLGGDGGGLRNVVRSDADTSRAYFEAIAKIADAVRTFVETEAPERVDFDGVLKELDDPERAAALEGDVYESELRPHRAALTALAARASEPRLAVDAELVYVYPFAIDEEIDFGKLLSEGVSLPWPDDEHPRHLPARPLERNDLWDRPDVPGPGYSGASIDLPEIAFTTSAGEALEFTAEMRLSRLGNHHLRVASHLDDAGVTELNQALRRGTPGMGAESLRWNGQPDTCVKFAHYATHVIAEIADAVGAKPVIDPNAQFHVVVAARTISVRRPGAEPTPATLAELGVTDGEPNAEPVEPVVGTSLLFHPVRHLATSLEEWIRYPAPKPTNLLAGQAYEGDLVVRTDNTTVSWLPTSPDWLAEEYEEMIEFVAAVPPLLALWANRAEDETARLDRILHRVEERIEQGGDPIEELYEDEKKIRALESAIRRDLAVLHSPGLCRTTAHRQFLDNVWNAAGLPAREAELDRRLALLADRQQRIARLVSSIDQRIRRKQQEHAERLERAQEQYAKAFDREQESRTKRLEAPINILIVLFGVASLAEVLSWFNDVSGGVDGRGATVIEGALLMVVAILATSLAVRRYRRSSK